MMAFFQNGKNYSVPVRMVISFFTLGSKILETVDKLVNILPPSCPLAILLSITLYHEVESLKPFHYFLAPVNLSSYSMRGSLLLDVSLICLRKTKHGSARLFGTVLLNLFTTYSVSLFFSVLRSNGLNV